VKDRGWLRSAFLALLLVPAAHTASAHVVGGEAIGFLSGFVHPISGLDHVLAMISVGLWGAQLGAPAIWLLPVTFPIMMAMGGLLGFLGMPLPGVEIGIAMSMVMLGLAVTLEARMPLVIVAGIVGFFAIFHGHAHGTELPPGQNAMPYSMGFVVATGCLHLVGILIGTVHKWGWGRTALKLAGSGVGLAGIFFLVSAVT
jgi:urease accessory protein